MRRTRARTLGRGAVIISFGNRMHSDENRAFPFLSLVGGLISLTDTWDRFVGEYRKCSIMRSNFFFFFDSMFSYFPSGKFISSRMRTYYIRIRRFKYEECSFVVDKKFVRSFSRVGGFLVN